MSTPTFRLNTGAVAGKVATAPIEPTSDETLLQAM